MILSTRPITQFALILLVAVASPAIAEDLLVSTQPEYEQALAAVQPGGTIVLANGEWRDFEILFTGKGTDEQPITLTAETKGQVLITGRSNLLLAGEYLVVSGLVFRNGQSPGSAVIAFGASEENHANHSRVTEVVVEDFNKPDERERDSYVLLYGKHNRVDHSYFAGKTNLGSTIGVELNDEGSLENHHRIDHNHFGPRPELGFNGGETIRIGNSWSSMNDSLTVVENNLFYRCDGEHEIISNKSGGNIYRGNLFLESRGTLTLRHGNNTLVEKNVFLGNQVPDTGGVRVINKGQVVRNNYMHGLTGERFRGGLVVMNGIPDSPLNRYHQVDNALIENNSIIDVNFVELAAGSNEERTLPPINSVFRANLVFNADGRDIIRTHDDISGIEFTGNSIGEDVRLEKGANGLLYPADPALAGTGASRELVVLDRADTGPSWYPKPGLVLVTGITGNQGGGVANAVLDRGFEVRGLSRNISSDRSREWIDRGVEMVQGDFSDYDSMKRAVKGVDYLFLNISERIPDFLAVASGILDAADAAGVRHIVLTTSRSANPESGFVIEDPNHKRSLELYLRQSGYSYSTLRVPSMMENLMRESGMRNVLIQGLIDYGNEGTLFYYMCSRDIGLLAAAAFSDPRAWNGREVNMASDALTTKQLSILLSELSGIQIQYRTAPWTEYSGRFAALLEFYDEEESPNDLVELRNEFPAMQTLEEYLRSQNYGEKLRKVSAILEPAQTTL